MVKARELINAIINGNYEAEVVDEGDFYVLLKESDSECTIFALNQNNEVCGFNEDELELDFLVGNPDELEPSEKEKLVSKLKTMGYAYLPCEEAFRRLAESHKIDYDF